MEHKPRYQYIPVPLRQVQITGGFWQAWQETNRAASILSVLHFLEETGRIDALKLQWKAGDPNQPHVFWDSDVAKWLEGACYSLVQHPDAELEARVEQVVTLLAASQQADGYLNSHYTVVEPDKRWTNLRDRHELYCAGHLMEAAVAHHQATGRDTFLNVMRRYADYIGQTFGPRPGQKRGYPGHEEIELALVRLAEETGEERYRELAKFFIDERGTQPHYYTQEAISRGEDPNNWHWVTTENEVSKVDYRYNQSHCPVREQTDAVGHAVRAVYLYSGMADIAAAYGDEALLQACERVFDSILHRRSYVTGGLGSQAQNEGFSEDYDLPNADAYAETCAAIGLIFWLRRMSQFACEAKYTDLLERALYNGFLVGLSHDGRRFFYSSPLAVDRQADSRYSNYQGHRAEWYGCSCCPPNVNRLLASLGSYLYASNDAEIVTHLYAESAADFNLAGGSVHLEQHTLYPWDGDIALELAPEVPMTFSVRMRIPGWCDSFTLEVNGISFDAQLEHGYLVLERQWQAGDTIRLKLRMAPRRVYAHPAVRVDRGRVALAYGPMLYCLEGVDNGEDLDRFVLPQGALIDPSFDPHLLGGVATLEGMVQVPQKSVSHPLYQEKPYPYELKSFKAIPFAYWDNRAEGDMLLWIREA
ncbi:MAG: glycoside hydrolase family 127 protein [Anaerolineae bacterium]|nr:glycoside hydrolase family 127 protein [Anaerolineae bacterium]